MGQLAGSAFGEDSAMVQRHILTHAVVRFTCRPAVIQVNGILVESTPTAHTTAKIEHTVLLTALIFLFYTHSAGMCYFTHYRKVKGGNISGSGIPNKP